MKLFSAEGHQSVSILTFVSHYTECYLFPNEVPVKELKPYVNLAIICQPMKFIDFSFFGIGIGIA